MPRLLNSTKKQTGFTLIELLVVILVIGALSGVLLSVINSSEIRGKARDNNRKTDLKRIQAALELYFAENREYPQDTAGAAWDHIAAGYESGIKTELQPNFVNPIPQDPKNYTSEQNSPCSDEDRYRYNYQSNGATYLMTAIMEVTSSNDDSPCGTTVGCGGSYDTSDYCYLVRNP